jgi:homoserine dehydrogenase
MPPPPPHGVDLYYEAAVAGAIPICCARMRESLAGDDVRKVIGIVNGTTNFVLDKMDTTGRASPRPSSQAQALGYAEADPTADVEGFDAAAKAAILASLAFHTRVASADVHREGITEVTAATSRPPRRWTASSSCSRSASAPMAKTALLQGFPCESTRR